MIQKFPYTNLHELNLDWIIQQLIKIEQGAVLSVNGQTGEVILYQDADVQLPDVVQPDGTWRFFRYVNGKPVGIKFDENGHAYMVDQYLTETEIYTERNQPDYPVESVNGQTGAVELYQQNGIRFPDVTENYWNIRREVDHNGSPSVEGLEFKDSLPMERISGQNRYKVYDEGNTVYEYTLEVSNDDFDKALLEIIIIRDPIMEEDEHIVEIRYDGKKMKGGADGLPFGDALDKNYRLEMPKEYAEALHLPVPESRNILKFDDFIKEDNTKVGKQPAANMFKTAKDYDKAAKNGYVKLREDYIHSFIDEHEPDHDLPEEE